MLGWVVALGVWLGLVTLLVLLRRNSTERRERTPSLDQSLTEAEALTRKPGL